MKVRRLGLTRIRCLELLSNSPFVMSIGVMIVRSHGKTTRIIHWCHVKKSRVYTREVTRDELVHLMNRYEYVAILKKEIAV